MSLKASDFVREPCGCAECEQAGVSDQQQQRDPSTGAWLHGYALKRALAAKERFWSGFRELMHSKSMETDR